MSEETQYAIPEGRFAVRNTQHASRNTHHASLAIIVVSYNVRELLRACLRATYASLACAPEVDATVWVVDNASADGSAEMVAAEFPHVRLVASRENLGFAGGNNRVLRAVGFGERESGGALREEQRGGGAEARRGPFGGADNTRTTEYALRNTHHAPHPDLVLLLNPDAEPVDDAVGQMARFLLAHPEVGGAGAQLRYPDGRFQHGAFRFPGLFQLWFDLFPPRPRRLLDSRLNGRYPRAAYDDGRPFPIDFALGAALDGARRGDRGRRAAG